MSPKHEASHTPASRNRIEAQRAADRRRAARAQHRGEPASLPAVYRWGMDVCAVMRGRKAPVYIESLTQLYRLTAAG
jgi:hypothetical protein